MRVYVVVVHDTLDDRASVHGVFESQDVAELEAEDLANTRLSYAVEIVEQDVQ